MFFNLLQLPYDLFGIHIIGFLTFEDIIQFENAAASHDCRELLRGILSNTPQILLKTEKSVLPEDCWKWCMEFQCRVQPVKMSLSCLNEINSEVSVFVLDNISIYLSLDTPIKFLAVLKNPNIAKRITRVHIHGSQLPEVMKILFSLLPGVRCLHLEGTHLSNNQLEWIEHARQICAELTELFLNNIKGALGLYMSFSEHCPKLQCLCMHQQRHSQQPRALETIARHCSGLRVLHIDWLMYSNSAEADADLTAFAEKCPQLEELSLWCEDLTDLSVIALAQHCSRLKKLVLRVCKLTTTSLIALSERDLPLEELDIPSIPIICDEVAAQCTHALSRIRKLHTYSLQGTVLYLRCTLQYVTGLRSIELGSPEDHLLVPHLLLCVGLESLSIAGHSSVTPALITLLVTVCPNLRSFNCATHLTDATVLGLARSCPLLEEAVLSGSSAAVTVTGVVALAVHCRQLRDLRITYGSNAVQRLLQRCRRLAQPVGRTTAAGVRQDVALQRRGIWALRETTYTTDSCDSSNSSSDSSRSDSSSNSSSRNNNSNSHVIRSTIYVASSDSSSDSSS